MTTDEARKLADSGDAPKAICDALRSLAGQLDTLQAKVAEQKALYDAAVDVATLVCGCRYSRPECLAAIERMIANAAEEGKKSEN